MSFVQYANNIYLNNSNVGIGKTNPTTLLDVNGTITSTNFNGSGLSLTTLNSSNINTGTLSVSYGGTGLTSLSVNNLLIGNGTNSLITSNNLVWASNNLGIGKNNPVTTLDVNGTIIGTLFSGSGASIFSLNSSNINVGTLSVSYGGTGANTLSSNSILVGNSTSIFLQPSLFVWDNINSRVGIGKTNPTSTLDVNGIITGIYAGSGASLSNLNGSNVNTGTLAVSYGGIGTFTFATNALLIGNGTNTLITNPNLLWDNSNNRLGIGLSNPLELLHFDDNLMIERTNAITSKKIYKYHTQFGNVLYTSGISNFMGYRIQWSNAGTRSTEIQLLLKQCITGGCVGFIKCNLLIDTSNNGTTTPGLYYELDRYTKQIINIINLSCSVTRFNATGVEIKTSWDSSANCIGHMILDLNYPSELGTVTLTELGNYYFYTNTKSISLISTNQYAYTNWSITQTQTVSMWVRVDTSFTSQGFWLFCSGDNYYPSGSIIGYAWHASYLYYNNGLKVDFYNLNGPTSTYSVDNWNLLGNWHHFCFVYDYTSGNGSKTFYIDGHSQGTTLNTTAPTILNAPIFVIANRKVGTGFETTNPKALFEEVAVWDKALSANEVYTIYNNGVVADLTSNSGNYISSNNLQAYWRFENNGNDSSGKGRTLTIVGSPLPSYSVLVPSFANTKSISFNGTSQYGTTIMKSASVTSWYNSKNYSVSAWIKRNATGARHTITHKYSLATYNSETRSRFCHYFIVESTNLLTLEEELSSSFGSQHLRSTTVINAGVWYHVAYTWSATNEVRIYVNGVHEKTEQWGDTIPYTGDIDFRVSTGWGAAPNSVFNGLIDDISYWNTSLTAVQITELYNNSVPGNLGIHSAKINLQAWWRFELNNGNDYSGNNRHLTLVGSPSYSNDLSTFTNTKSLALNGSNQYGTVNMTSWIVYKNYTFSAWIKISSTTVAHTLYHPYALSGNTFNNWIWIDGNRLTYSHQSPSAYSVSASTLLAANKWYHICVSKDSNNIERIYLNGVLDNIPVASRTESTTYTGTIELDIGAGWDRSGIRNFGGIMDEISYWNTTLTNSQILELYNNGIPNNVGIHSAKTNLQAWYRFELNNGNDYSGNNRTLSFSNSPTFSNDSAYVNIRSLSLNGTQILSGAQLFTCTSTQPFTYSCWFNWNGGAEQDGLISNGTPSSISNNSGNLCFLSVNPGFYRFGLWGIQSIDLTIAIPTGTWTHVAFINRPASNATAFYVNGTEYIKEAYTGTYNGSNVFSLGNYWSNYSENNTIYALNGLIDDVGIWNSSLTAAEITSIYNSGKPMNLSVNNNNYASSSSLQAWWRFEKSDGSDFSGYNRNLTLYGSPSFSTNVP